MGNTSIINKNMSNKKLFDSCIGVPANTDRFAFGTPSTAAQNITLSELRKAITGTTAPISLCTKVVNIGNWDMCGTPGVNVSTGIALSKIRSVDVIIRSDACELFPLTYPNDNMELSGYWKICNVPSTNAVIALSRKYNYFFYQSAFCCAYWNRGYITLTYEP